MADTQVTNLVKEVQHLEHKINSHINSGNGAHLPVDKQNAGFATPSLLDNLDESLGNLSYKKPGTNIQQLAPGKYYGYGFNGTSWGDNETGLLEVFVSSAPGDASGQENKQIVEIESVSGSIKILTFHTNSTSTVPKVWTSVERTAELWRGNISAVGTKILLNDLPSNYTFLRVTTSNGSNVVKATYIPYASVVAINSVNLYNTAPGLTFNETGITFNGKQAVLSENITYNDDQNGVYKDTNLANVIKIEGVK